MFDTFCFVSHNAATNHIASKYPNFLIWCCPLCAVSYISWNSFLLQRKRAFFSFYQSAEETQHTRSHSLLFLNSAESKQQILIVTDARTTTTTKSNNPSDLALQAECAGPPDVLTANEGGRHPQCSRMLFYRPELCFENITFLPGA